jgi:hypothetical protein
MESLQFIDHLVTCDALSAEAIFCGNFSDIPTYNMLLQNESVPVGLVLLSYAKMFWTQSEVLAISKIQCPYSLHSPYSVMCLAAEATSTLRRWARQDQFKSIFQQLISGLSSSISGDCTVLMTLMSIFGRGVLCFLRSQIPIYSTTLFDFRMTVANYEPNTISVIMQQPTNRKLWRCLPADDQALEKNGVPSCLTVLHTTLLPHVVTFLQSKISVLDSQPNPSSFTQSDSEVLMCVSMSIRYIATILLDKRFDLSSSHDIVHFSFFTVLLRLAGEYFENPEYQKANQTDEHYRLLLEQNAGLLWHAHFTTSRISKGMKLQALSFHSCENRFTPLLLFSTKSFFFHYSHFQTKFFCSLYSPLM